MKTPDDETISRAVDIWVRDMINALSSGAAAAYAAGEFRANGYLRLGVGFDVIQQEALQYATEYKRQLVETGTTTVTVPAIDENGKPIPGKWTTTESHWLAERSAAMRSEIADIIRNGIAEGKATGVTQRSTGNYGKNTIAEDLKTYFDSVKSQASTIARTETCRCYYNGETARYASGGVEYVQYLGGPNACEICDPYIGQIFKLGSQPPLPMHPNCRCDYRPYYPALGEVLNTNKMESNHE